MADNFVYFDVKFSDGHHIILFFIDLDILFNFPDNSGQEKVFQQKVGRQRKTVIAVVIVDHTETDGFQFLKSEILNGNLFFLFFLVI